MSINRKGKRHEKWEGRPGKKKNDDDYGDHYSLLEDIYTII